MAQYHFTTGIIGASKGKCAVASAAYISAERLYDEKQGIAFSYTRKEEVVHKEILLPPNAPARFYDRETLWNDIERVQNKSNSRYARQFEMSIPREWISEGLEVIKDRVKEYIEKEFVSQGMAVDWAIHMKESAGGSNPHVHAMAPVRGFNEDGSWAAMTAQKRGYALDEQGNKIPLLDPETGKQKVRERPGKGKELLWKREKKIIEVNKWNQREQLISWRKSWEEHCNRWLSEEQKIDSRSLKDQGINRVPTVHEGYAAREMIQREGAVIPERIQENNIRRRINQMLEKIEEKAHIAFKQIKELKQTIKERIVTYGKVRGIGEDRNIRTTIGNNRGLSAVSDGYQGSIRQQPGSDGWTQQLAGAERKPNYSPTADHNIISTIRTRLSALIESNNRIAAKLQYSGSEFSERSARTKQLDDIGTEFERRKQEAQRRTELQQQIKEPTRKQIQDELAKYEDNGEIFKDWRTRNTEVQQNIANIESKIREFNNKFLQEKPSVKAKLDLLNELQKEKVKQQALREEFKEHILARDNLRAKLNGDEIEKGLEIVHKITNKIDIE